MDSVFSKEGDVEMLVWGNNSLEETLSRVFKRTQKKKTKNILTSELPSNASKECLCCIGLFGTEGFLSENNAGG
jgi:hypothetical protein